MTDSVSSRVLRAALFTLVPIAYLSMRFWRPLVTYYYGKDDTSFYFFTIFMSAVLVVSLLSWNKHRAVAVLGLAAYFLWFAFWIQPVI
jgi:hypothetical protein